MEEEKVLSNLRRANPWWTGENPIQNEREFYLRSQFYYLRKQIEEKEVTGILGPRQVGKTTVMKQIISHLLEKDISPERILYVQLDSPYLVEATEEPIRDIFQVFQELVLEEDFKDLDSSAYIFLDEIQAVDKWAEKLKFWYEKNYDIIFVISGSSSAEITAGSESLLGRINERRMLPMKFSETLRMKEHFDDISLGFDFAKNKNIMKNVFNKALREEDGDYLYQKFLSNQSFLVSDKATIRSELDYYVKRGGLPRIIHRETVKGIDMDYAAERLGTDIEKAIKKDASDVFDVRSQILMEVMLYISDNIAQRLVISNLADNTEVSRPTVRKYMQYLEAAHLIHRTAYYSNSKAASTRKKDKVYVLDPGYRNALVGALGGGYTLSNDEYGRLIESVVANHVKRLSYNLGGAENDVYFWYDKNKEVDLVLKKGETAIPIEVKHRSSISKSDLSGINAFLYDNGADFGMVLTKDRLGRIEVNNGEVIAIPVWQFLSWV